MKVSLIIGSFYPAVVYGGPIFSTLNLGQEMARLGIQVNVSTTNANNNEKLDVKTNEFIKFQENLFIKYYGWANRRSFSLPMLLNMWRDIKQADVVFLQPVFSSYVPVALFYARLFGKPLLLSPRGSLRHWCLQSGSRFKTTWLKLFIEPLNDRIYWHATSQQEADEIRTIYKDAKIFCIPNGVDIKEFEDFSLLSPKEYMKKFTNKDMECKGIIVSMARLHKVKGFDILIDAFKIIINKFPEAVLLIAGQDAGEKDALLKQIKILHIEDRVFLIGQIDGRDKADFLANADVFVLPSHNENFGIVCAEALAAETPVVASRSTPWCEIEHNNCGCWVDNTPEEIAKAVTTVLVSDYREMGKKGREYIFDKFNWKNIALEFKKTFELIIH